jgi:phage/plasmid-associated DNA primase
VQNPDENPGTVIVLKSRREGTGKSTLGVAMLKIFGAHGQLVDDKDRVFSRFNDWLETVSFVLAEEILWANDHRSADKLKSVITSPTIQVERKHGTIWQLPNRLHVIMTTNHDHAVPAGVGNRRFVVYDVSEERACDRSWFDPLYRDLDNGGAGEFLYLLQNVQLAGWHPREMLTTAEASEQQRMSGDCISQWSQACIDADPVVGFANGFSHDLGEWISTEMLREAYSGYCRQNSLHPVSGTAFGQACTEFFGPRRRAPVTQQPVSTIGPVVSFGAGKRQRRPWGYRVPGGRAWQAKVDARLGIR